MQYSIIQILFDNNSLYLFNELTVRVSNNISFKLPITFNYQQIYQCVLYTLYIWHIPQIGKLCNYPGPETALSPAGGEVDWGWGWSGERWVEVVEDTF